MLVIRCTGTTSLRLWSSSPPTCHSADAHHLFVICLNKNQVGSSSRVPSMYSLGTFTASTLDAIDPRSALTYPVLVHSLEWSYFSTNQCGSEMGM